MKPHVLVIGGGFAGASAASALAEAGVSVTLVEKRATLGGRASSLRDGVTREEVDNGQHLFMGCYRETRRFLKRLKVEDRLRFLSRMDVPFLSPEGKSRLGDRGGLLAGLLGFGALSVGDRFSLLRGLLRARFTRRRDLASLTVTRWLDILRQTPGARRAFWHPLCLATLNASPNDACAAAFMIVLREGLFAGAAARALGFARVSLGKLWPVELPGYLKSRGGVLSTEQSVTGFEVAGGLVTGVRLAGGHEGEVDAVVCAVPLPAFLEICPPEIRPGYAALEKTAFSPILSVNFWFERPVFDGLFAGLLGTEVQWIFNRAALWEGRGASAGHITLVLSDARAWETFSTEDILARALADLRRVIRHVPEPKHGTVVWERQATPVPSPAFWAARPPVTTPLKNFFLAGDWVDTGLPPTIESACRAGHRAAAEAKKYLEGAPAPEAAPC